MNRFRRLSAAALAATIAIALAVASLYALDIVAGRLVPAAPSPPRPDDVYFREIAPEEAHAYARARYDSFTVWGYADFIGRHVTIENGFRRTVQPAPGFGGSTQTVWFFGGSTMLGQGAADAETIPSLACAALARRHVHLTWRCRNFGLGGYVNTQSLVLLLTLLREPGRERPDAIVFYDGVNEVIAAWEGHPGDHHNFPAVRARVERDARSWSVAAQDLRALAARQFPHLFRLAGAPTAADANTGDGRPPAPLMLDDTRQAAAFYAGNFRTLGDWSDGARIPTLFVLQPTVFDKTPLHPDEQAVQARAATAFAPLWTTFRDAVRARPPADRAFLRFVDLADALDGAVGQHFYDDWMHINGAGNRVIAERLADLIEPDSRF